MKKLSLIIAALAMMLGITQCKKQENPVGGKLITQEVTFTTSFGDGSKLGVTETEGTLDLSWKEGDEITVTDGAAHTRTLKCNKVSDGGLTGTFTGEIVYESGELKFTVGTEPDYMNQHFTSITENEIYLKGTSEFKQDGDYNVGMSLPYAILKLDLAELATAEGVDVYVTIGGNEVAIVKGVKTSASQVYLLLPLQASGETTLTFTNGTKTITKTYNLAPNSFNSAGGNGGYAPVEPEAPATPKFTVGENTTVEFSPGNLYWDGSAFHFEANQWDYRHYSRKKHDAAVIGGVSQTTPSGTVGSFFWSKTASVAYASSYSDSGTTTSDVFFTNSSSFQVSGETAGTWRTLSNGEWNYLLNSRANATSLRAWKELDSGAHKGLVILPDGTENPSTVMSGITSTSDLATSGAVFLPAAGLRDDLSVDFVGSYGRYWLSTPVGDNVNYAYRMYFESDDVGTSYGSRNNGHAVRLVR